MRRAVVLAAISTIAAGCNTVTSTTLNKTVPAGQTRKVDFFTSLNADCSLYGDTVIRVKVPPRAGQVSIQRSNEHPTYPRENQRYACNEKTVPGTLVLYTPQPGYVGTDTFSIDVIFPTGSNKIWSYNVTVK